MPLRRMPETKEKEQYRQLVLRLFDRYGSLPKSKRRVAILEESKGIESKGLLLRGYKPSNILAVNKSAAILAWASISLKRCGFSTTTTRAGNFSTVLGECREAFNCIHFDTCSTINKKDLRKVLKGLSSGGLLVYNICPAHDIYKGHHSRFTAIKKVLPKGFIVVDQGVYYSQSPRLWVAIHNTNH